MTAAPDAPAAAPARTLCVVHRTADRSACDVNLTVHGVTDRYAVTAVIPGYLYDFEKFGGAVSRVRLWPEPADDLCSCPHHTHRRSRCKHMAAARKLVELGALR